MNKNIDPLSSFDDSGYEEHQQFIPIPEDDFSSGISLRFEEEPSYSFWEKLLNDLIPPLIDISALISILSGVLLLLLSILLAVQYFRKSIFASKIKILFFTQVITFFSSIFTEIYSFKYFLTRAYSNDPNSFFPIFQLFSETWNIYFFIILTFLSIFMSLLSFLLLGSMIKTKDISLPQKVLFYRIFFLFLAGFFFYILFVEGNLFTGTIDPIGAGVSG